MAYGLGERIRRSFLLILSFATFMQFNLDFSRAHERGLLSRSRTLIAQQLAGWSADKWSLTATSWIDLGQSHRLVGGFILILLDQPVDFFRCLWCLARFNSLRIQQAPGARGP